jgi:hypothetical protein
MTFMFPDGRALDDAEPQDAARELARLFQTLALHIANGGPTEDDRDAVVEELTHVSALMRVWAEFGRWRDPDLERRTKALTELVIAFAGPHAKDTFSTHCPACIAERQLRAIAKTMGGNGR